MNKEIVFPTENEKEDSIQYILNQYQSEKKMSTVLKPFKELPLSIIFHSSLIVKVLSLLAILLYFLIIGDINSIFQNPTDQDLTIIMMFFSPILYLIHLIDTSKSFSENMYELECTLKYKFHQIIAYKFILLTLISLFLNFLLICVYPNINFIEGSMTVLSSIFMMTSFIYYVVLRFKNGVVPFVLILMWGLINFGLITIIPDPFFQTYKVTLYIIGTIFAFLLHFFQFKTLFSKYQIGGTYA